jgi:GNAT superfamily N-acetyltransferase
MKIVTLAQHPELAGQAFDIPYAAGSPVFMQGDLAALLVNSARLASRWPEYTIAVLDTGGAPVARGVSVPFAGGRDGRDSYPAAGWDQIAVWVAEDAMDEVTPDTVCALEIAVHPDHQRRGLSATTLAALRDNARRLGFTRLVAPVRPPAKADEPALAMTDYMRRTRADGLPDDPWLRVHVRHGGQLVTVAPCSGAVQAPLQQWRAWTGLAFDHDGEVIVPGALAPVLVSTRHDIGAYVEPNVWVLHDLTDSDRCRGPNREAAPASDG